MIVFAKGALVAVGSPVIAAPSVETSWVEALRSPTPCNASPATAAAVVLTPSTVPVDTLTSAAAPEGFPSAPLLDATVDSGTASDGTPTPGSLSVLSVPAGPMPSTGAVMLAGCPAGAGAGAGAEDGAAARMAASRIMWASSTILLV
ncbi:hypothetical protein Vafri_14098 [Volvox africanus]|nr:hypothetical protein Vafri_14098 [Volvox africanus]